MLNATFDPYIIYQNMSKHSLNVKYYNPTDSTFIGTPNRFISNSLDGIKIENYFSGKTIVTHNEINYDIKLEINIEIFSERVVLKELIIECEDKKFYYHYLDLGNQSFYNKKVYTWDVD